MKNPDTRAKPLYRMLLLALTVGVSVPLMQGMLTGSIPSGPIRVLILASLALVAFLVLSVGRQQVLRRASARRVSEFLVFFDDANMLRPRAQAARALLAGEAANELERRSLVAVSQCLAELATAVEEGGDEGRGAVLAHTIVGAWLRALAVTPIALSFSEAQRGALQQLFVEMGAARHRREPLDDGSRALLERDAVLYRSEEAERIF